MRGRNTKRLEQCIEWMAQGKTYQEIAELLGVNIARAHYICRDARLWRDKEPHWTDGLSGRTAATMKRNFKDRAHFERWMVAHKNKLSLIEGIYAGSANEIMDWMQNAATTA